MAALEASPLRSLCIVGVLGACLAAPVSADTADDVETQMWQYASGENTIIALETFIYSYPDSNFMAAAKLQLETAKARQDAAEVEAAIFELAGPVTFETPLMFGDEDLRGKTLSQVMTSSPTYPPVEGLPASYWENQECSNCHQWTRETICTQATNYIGMDPVTYQNKLHPFGGALKINLRNWAQNDCD